NLRLYPGNYSVYLDHKKAEEAKEVKAQKNQGKLSQSATPPNPPLARGGESQESEKPRKLTFNEKREYEKLEVKIPQMEAEKAEIEQILSLNSPSGFGEVKKLSERLGQLNQEIDLATEKWLELAERVS
ncbi:MAG: ABC transporter ATP-binding protein, partial [Oscillatoriales cyanobacterium]